MDDMKIIVPLQVRHQTIIGVERTPRLLVEHTQRVFYLDLDFDEEWQNCGIEVIMDNTTVDGDPLSQAWNGVPLEIPGALLQSGELRISCVGHAPDGRQLVTRRMPDGIQVYESGRVIGYIPGPGDEALWKQVMAAVGSLDFLKTEDKSSIVNAVNEIFGKAIKTITQQEIVNENGQFNKVTILFENGERTELYLLVGEDGKDGYSPTVTVKEIPGGHELTVTNQTGAESFQVLDGKDGIDGGAPIVATCYDEADPVSTAPNSWYVPKDMPRPSGSVGMMVDVQWINGKADGLGYDVQLIWGAPDGADNEIIVEQTNTSNNLTGEYNIPTEGTVRYQLIESNGRKHWRYVSGPLIPRQFSTDTAAATADKAIHGMALAYLPGMEVYITLDNGNTADLMRLVPDEGPTLPVYVNGRGATTGEIPAGYICHLINAGGHWVVDNLGSDEGRTILAVSGKDSAFTFADIIRLGTQPNQVWGIGAIANMHELIVGGSVLIPCRVADQSSRKIFVLGVVRKVEKNRCWVDGTAIFDNAPWAYSAYGTYPQSYVYDATDVVLSPNTHYLFKTPVENLNVSFGSVNEQRSSEFVFTFDTGTLPAKIKFADPVRWDRPLVTKPNKRYRVSIMSGLGTWVESESSNNPSRKLVVIASANPLAPDTYIADHKASEIRNADISGNMVELKYTAPDGSERLYRYEDFKNGQAVFRRVYPDTATGGVWTRANIMVNENKTIEIDYATGKAASPEALTFTGAVTGSYDGTKAMVVHVPTTEEIINDLPKWKWGAY